MCKCTCCGVSAKIQSPDMFTVGREVYFTDAYLRMHKSDPPAGLDWVVAVEPDKNNVLMVQRYGMPHTKVSIAWGWVYLK